MVTTLNEEQTTVWRTGRFAIHMMPRASMSHDQFLQSAPKNTIALDGVVRGGPFVDIDRRAINFDHHDTVVREATMSTCMQAYTAIKLGMMDMFAGEEVNVCMNDTDHDSTLAAFTILNYKHFENEQSLPHFNRLLSITDRWDITGGAYPMNLADKLVRQHNWVFAPYNDLRKSGRLDEATSTELRDNMESMFDRLNKFVIGQSEELELDTRHKIIHQSEHFWLVDEIGGTGARYQLWKQGMKAFIAIVSTRPNGRRKLAIGRRSQYIPFPVTELYKYFNDVEQCPEGEGWGGSSIVGGSSRKHGSGLSNEMLISMCEEMMEKHPFYP